jgi:S1-C subfamily serine protease
MRRNQRLAVQTAPPRPVTPRGDLSADEKSTIEVFQRNSSAVVNVTALSSLPSDFLLWDTTQIRRGSGTGFIWDADGHAVTNFHVVEGSDRFQITFADRTTVPARLIGVAPHKDLAALQIEPSAAKWTTIALGTSSDLQVGQKVFAIGNPFGLDQTLTTGIISGLGREIRSLTDRPIVDVIQTDAAINPGNSGGPLLDSAGRLIGVNTAIVSRSGAYDGIGFAIPVDTVNRVVPQLLKYGRVISPDLGIQGRDDTGDGVLVMRVREGGAADRAGIRPLRLNQRRQFVLGDLIIAMDDLPIKNLDDYYEALDKHEVGDTVSVTVVRGINTARPEKVTLNAVLQSET